MPAQPVIRHIALAGAAALATTIAATPALAALSRYANDLTGPSTSAYARPVDTALWSGARAPQKGRIVTVRVRGCAEPGSAGQQPPTTEIHFQVMHPGAGTSATIAYTSGPFSMPVCGGRVSASTISTFQTGNLCVARGDYVAFNDVGGFSPNGFASGVRFEVLRALAGASTFAFTGANQTNNGATVTGQRHPGLALQMGMTLGTGRDAGVCNLV